MLGGEEVEYQDFLSLHKVQLEHAGVPKHYYRRLYEKLCHDIYDSGSYFILLTDGESWEVQSTRTVDGSDANTIFLIDHCWTFHAEHLKKALREIPGLAPRIANIIERTGQAE